MMPCSMAPQIRDNTAVSFKTVELLVFTSSKAQYPRKSSMETKTSAHLRTM